MISRLALLPHPLFSNIRVSKEFLDEEEMNFAHFFSDVETEDELLTAFKSNYDRSAMNVPAKINPSEDDGSSPFDAIDAPISSFQVSERQININKNRDGEIQEMFASPNVNCKKSSLGRLNGTSAKKFNGKLKKLKRESDSISIDRKRKIKNEPDVKNNAKKKVKSKNAKKTDKKTNKRRRVNVVEDDDEDEAEVLPPMEEEEDEDEDEYEVERIVTKKTEKGVIQFLVKWLGYPWNENTWEPLSHLVHCNEKIREFERNCLDRAARGLSATPPVSEDEDRDEEAIDEDDTGEDRLPLRKFVTGFLNIHFGGVVPPIPDESMGDLQPRQQLTNFTVDDVIFSLIHLLKLKRVGFIPNFHFNSIYSNLSSLADIGYFRGPIQFIHRHGIGTANYVFVACSTLTKDADPDSNHFVLGVICKNKQKVIVLDSLRIHKKSLEEEKKQRINIFKTLGMFVIMNYRVMNLDPCLEDWEFIYSTDCPQQHNNFDCGVYSIINALYIMSNVRPPKDTLKPSIFARSFIGAVKSRYPIAPVLPIKHDHDLIEKTMLEVIRYARDFSKEFEENYVSRHNGLTQNNESGKIIPKAASNILKSLPTE